MRLEDMYGVLAALILTVCSMQGFVTGADTWAKCTIEKTSGEPSQEIEGTVYFKQKDDDDVTVWVNLVGFDPNNGLDVHGFHIHENGELGDKCKDAGGHFNPEDKVHGSPNDEIRHVGDLGNVEEDEHGRVNKMITDDVISLSGTHNIVGKAVVVHETFDDLGKGGYDDSTTTGHAGARLGCCVIESTTQPDAELGPWEEKAADCKIESSSGQPSQPIQGVVIFKQPPGFADVTISVDLTGFDVTDGLDEHGFHVHEEGDLGNQCGDAGGHFNPENVVHGGPNDDVRHVGDLGNVDEDGEGNVQTFLTDRIIKLTGTHNIVGKSVVVHETFDDLNKGNEVDSNTTGHAGSRLGCCLITELEPLVETWAKCEIKTSTGTSQPIEGTVTFHQPAGFGDIEIDVSLSGFNTTDGLNRHGFHIHESGELGNQCKDAGGHYNPAGMVHGAPTDAIRHVGDLGNVEEDSEGQVKVKLRDHQVKLSGDISVMGRAVVVHETYDDLNKEDHSDSNTTGHAGSRIGCCKIEQYSGDDNTGVADTVHGCTIGWLLLAVMAALLRQLQCN